MKLSDVMSAMDLAVFAEVGLVLFLAAFAAVAIDVIWRGRSLEALASMPLDPKSTAESGGEEPGS
jgi:hypothetical protein